MSISPNVLPKSLGSSQYFLWFPPRYKISQRNKANSCENDACLKFWQTGALYDENGCTSNPETGMALAPDTEGNSRNQCTGTENSLTIGWSSIAVILAGSFLWISSSKWRKNFLRCFNKSRCSSTRHQWRSKSGNESDTSGKLSGCLIFSQFQGYLRPSNQDRFKWHPEDSWHRIS